MTSVSAAPVAGGEVSGDGLPEPVRDALGELAGAAREGLLALSVGVGLGVLHELMEAEVDEVVGLKGRHDSERVAVRHGHEGRRGDARWSAFAGAPARARTADGAREVEL
jgi:putative transposase